MAAHRTARVIASPYSDRTRVCRRAWRPGRAGPATAQQRSASVTAPLAHKPTQVPFFSVVAMPNRPLEPATRPPVPRRGGPGPLTNPSRLRVAYLRSSSLFRVFVFAVSVSAR